MKEQEKKEVKTKKEDGTEEKGESTAVKIFGMFDKIDDIIYEPIHLMCETLSQPLKGMQANREIKAKEKEAKLEVELAQKAKEFEQDLMIRQRKLEMEQTKEEKEMEEGIRQLIVKNDLATQEEMARLEVKFRQDMAEAAVKIASIVQNIAVESREKILALYKEKETSYLEMQKIYKKDMIESLNDLRAVFPDGSGDDIVREEMSRQLIELLTRTSDFCNLLNKDMEKVLGIIDNQTNLLDNITSKYFMPNQQTPVLNGITTQNQNILEEANVVQVIDEQ